MITKITRKPAKAKNGVQQTISDYMTYHPRANGPAYALAPYGDTRPVLLLPVEVFDHIISYFPPCPYPWSPRQDCPLDVLEPTFPHNQHLLTPPPYSLYDLQSRVYREYLAWRRRLTPISQVCRTFRARTLALLWRFYVIGSLGINDPKTWSHIKIRTSSDLVATQPVLQPLVRSVLLYLTVTDAAEAMPHLGRCLASLPNVTTIIAFHLSNTAHGQFHHAIKDISLPSVDKLVVTFPARFLISVCPNAREIFCTSEYGNQDGLITLNRLSKTKVQVLGGSAMQWYGDDVESRLRTLVRHARDLRELYYTGMLITKPIALLLSQLPKLHTIIICHSIRHKDCKFEACVQALREVPFPQLHEVGFLDGRGRMEKFPYVMSG